MLLWTKTNIPQGIYSVTKYLLNMISSIAEVTNPLKNSINEKVARIREVFVTRFKESLSTNYIVNGERGGAKRVLLNR